MKIDNKLEEFNNKIEENKDLILLGIFVFWFFLYLLSFIYLFTEMKSFQMLFILGLFLFGLYFVYSNRKSKDNISNNLLKLILVILSIIGIFITFFSKNISIQINPFIIFIMVIFSLFFGGGFLFLVKGIMLFIAQKTYVKIEATVEDYKKLHRGAKQCIFKYNFEGKDYVSTDSFMYAAFAPNIGATKVININPNNPEEIISHVSYFIFIIFSIPILFFAITWLVLWIQILST